MKKILSFFAAMLVAVAASAAVINIDTSTANAIQGALNSAASGDEIVLAAGTYNESGNYLAFTGKELTVRAAEGAEVIIKTVCPVRLKEGAKAEFINIKFDCSTIGEYEQVIVAADDTENKRVVLKGCEFYGWQKNKAMIQATSSRRLAQVMITDCYFHDCMKSVVFMENTNPSDLIILNSTFANIYTDASSFWAGVIDSRATSGLFVVDRCTFYNVLAMNTDYAAVGKVSNSASTVTNSIFMLPASQDNVRAIRDVAEAVNCITYNYLKDSGKGIHSDVTKTNCIQQDPLFVNAAEGNFTLGEGSPALTLADGEPVGDPRWVPSVAPVEPLMKTIYCKMDKAWWKADGAAVGVYTWDNGGNAKAAWPGERMTPVEGETDLWSVELDINTYHMCIFTRVNGTGDIADWGAKTGDLTIPTDEKDLYTITSESAVWGDPGVAGEWSKYEPSAPVVLDAPDAAPAEPTLQGYQVKAVYSAKYSADCSFGEWGSGTQYAQEDYGKKFVTAALGYFGLEFSSHLDCSEMEALHLDAWIAEDASIHVVPIHGGAEVGVTVNLKGQQWNSIDIDLKKFEGVTNWSNVYQIKIDEAANLTFWLNNVYFYTTQTKTIDLVDGYYLIGTMNSWDIHNMTAADKFAVNPENDKEYKLTTTLAENDEFKVVEVANNAIVEGKWFPAEAGNYKVDFDHSGENKDIYFRPDYEGGEGWHAGCIFVAESVGNNPWTTYFAVGDTWNEEKESYLEWDADNEKATIHIAVDKNGQWRAQAKYRGLIAEAGKYYRVSLKMKANKAIQNVTIKYQDNDQAGAEMVLVTDAALEAGVEFVFDQKVAGTDGGNGIMALDFGFAKAGDIIEIYDVVIEEVFAKFYIAGNMTSWGDNKIPVFEDSYILEDLAAGKYQMKVVDGADWLGIKALTATADNLFIDQDGNICFILEEAGDVTVTFKKIEDEISAFTVTGNFVAPEIKLIGIKGWEEDTDAIAFESGTTEASVKLTLDGDWYDFKLIRAGEWLGKENEDGNYRIHSEYNFVDGLVRNYDGLKSISLQPDGAGVYEFVYEYATGKLQVNFPQEDPSAIENSEVSVKVQKLIENGQIVIIRNGEKFNAQGQLIR